MRIFSKRFDILKNMKDSKTWKDHLLKSGIPFEYEIKNYLEKKGCITDFEFSYLREDENSNIKEFSFDIDSSYIKNPFYFEFLVECKYRHESTKWVFLPEDYGGIKEIGHLDFLHLNDLFGGKSFDLKKEFPYSIGKLCSKGIEITTDSHNPKSIDQAISQLAFGVAEKIVNQYDHHINDVLKMSFSETFFSTIPIIVTTAKLFRINEDSDTKKIMRSSDINEISTEEPCIVLYLKNNIELTNHNREVFIKYFSDKTSEKIQPIIDSGTMARFLNNQSENTPRCILVVTQNNSTNGLNNLFAYLERVINPDKEVLRIIEDKKRKQRMLVKGLKKFRKRP